MKTFHLDDLKIVVDKEGTCTFSKVSYPLRYGRYSEIISPEHIFQFNLNGEIKFITGRGKNWPDPSEWLKRTVTNDWIYYSTGGYSGVYDSLGEYYLPCFSYPTNAINLKDPFRDKAVATAIDAWQELNEKITGLYSNSLPQDLEAFLKCVMAQSPRNFGLKARELYDIIGDRVTVLPPDTRHVDYEIIPIILADGCLYRCGFCRVKSRRGFSVRTEEDIKEQIRRLKRFYGRDIQNYNAIFLGQHDALQSGADLIEFAAECAYETFEFGRSNLKGSSLFLFGSVDSMMNADLTLFDRLETLPFSTYINIGLESVDQKTLSVLKKPISPESVEQTFTKAFEINRSYEKIEVTTNFVFGDGLPEGHLPSFFHMMEDRLDRTFSKGTVYFSPLINGREKRGIKRKFYEIKIRSLLPTFLYLIQRL